MLHKRPLVVFVSLCLILVLTLLASANLAPETKAPDFTLKDLAGKNVKFSKYFAKPGNVVVLDIWATWCPPCRSEIPELVKIQKAYEGKPVKVIGVATDVKLATVKEFAKENKINYTVCHDPAGKTIGPLYKVEGIPATYIIDKKGKIRYSHIGFPGDPEGQKKEVATFHKEIKSLL